MSILEPLASGLFLLAAIFALALVARHRGVLQTGQAGTLARIVTDICLPGMIFASLAEIAIDADRLIPALLMLGADVLIFAMAFGLGSSIRSIRPMLGPVLFCATFGSSTFLGYPIIAEVFPGSASAMGEAVLVSELGIGLPLLLFGPILARHFGSDEIDGPSLLDALRQFLTSPIAIALFTGLSWSLLELPVTKDSITYPLLHLGHLLGGAVTPLAIMTVALFYAPAASDRSYRSLLPALLLVIFLKLCAKPALCGGGALLLDLPDQWRAVLVLLAGMPPAIFGVVLLGRYGGNARVASRLLVMATAISIGTLLFYSWLFG